MKKLLWVFGIVSSLMMLNGALPGVLSATNLSPPSAVSSFGIQRLPPETKAPPFTLRNMKNQMVSLSDYRGKPLLLFFWGTWCLACKEDLVLLEKFASKANDQLTIVTVLIDGERKRRAQRIIERINLTLPVLLVCEEDIIDTYEVRMIPMALFINGNGDILGKVVGQRDWAAPLAWSATRELLDLH